MKRKWAVTAAAVGLALSAGAAQAKIATADSGNSELVLTVWDPVRRASYALDLGTLLSDFQPSDFTDPGFTLVWAPDALFTSFLTTSGANPLVWSVLGGDDNGNSAGSRGLAFTADPSYTETQIEANPTKRLNQALDLFDRYVGMLNGRPTHNQDLNGDGQKDTLDNGSSVVMRDRHAESMQSFFSQLPGLGDSQNFWFAANGQNRSSPVTATAYGIWAEGDFYHSTFTLQGDGTLVFAVPVPEAETWALLGLGLIGLGAYARRRAADAVAESSEARAAAWSSVPALA